MNADLLNRIQALPEPIEICMVLRVIAQQGPYSSIHSIASPLKVKRDFVKRLLIQANKSGYVTNEQGQLILHIPEQEAPERDNSPEPDDYIKACEKLREWALVKSEHAAEPVKIGSPEWVRNMSAISRAYRSRKTA